MRKIVDRDDVGVKAAVIPVPLPVARTRVVQGRAEAQPVEVSITSEEMARLNRRRSPIATSVVSIGTKPKSFDVVRSS